MYHTLIVLLGEFPHVSDYSTAGCIISIFAIIFGVAVVAVPAGELDTLVGVADLVDVCLSSDDLIGACGLDV